MDASLITLGCNKNEVDGEMIASYLEKKGLNLQTDLSNSDVIIINTCGFIQSAKEEAIKVILDAINYKEKKIGKCKHLIVVGCLAKRYKKEIYENFPEVDLVIGVDEYTDFDKFFSSYFKIYDLNSNFCLDFNNRKISSLFPMAYLRISDGCNNKCNYCAIPLIRGSLCSRKIEDIIFEAKELVQKGIRELCIISQDTTSYGKDLYGQCRLLDLIREISKIPDLKWIRVLYMYPGKISDELLMEFKNNPKLCKYFDIPVQHISNNILKGMNRHNTKKDIYDIIQKIRTNIPDSIIRTTVMTGYQGETEEDFKELLEGIKSLKFDRLGAFAFSKEDDTKAANIPGDISDKVKQERYNKVMLTQQEVLKSVMKSRLEKTYEVIVEDITENEEYFICRSYMDAPDVDPRIYIKVKGNENKVIIGEYYNVILKEIAGYDYIAILK